MDKCEGCPFDVFIYPENCCATGDATEPLPDCHLTPADFTLIKAAIAGEGQLFLWHPDMGKEAPPGEEQ